MLLRELPRALAKVGLLPVRTGFSPRKIRQKPVPLPASPWQLERAWGGGFFGGRHLQGQVPDRAVQPGYLLPSLSLSGHLSIDHLRLV